MSSPEPNVRAYPVRIKTLSAFDSRKQATLNSDTVQRNNPAAAGIVVKLSCMRTILLSLVLAATLAAAHKTCPQTSDSAEGFSHGVGPSAPEFLVDGTQLYVAGQTGTDVKTGKLPEDFEAEVKQALENAGAVCRRPAWDTRTSSPCRCI